MSTTTKQCFICKSTKSTTEFHKKTASLDGLKSSCIPCLNDRSKQYKKTKSGLVSRIYGSQVAHSKRRGHTSPEYTMKELKEWLYSKKLFHDIYMDWVLSGYTKSLSPSVDRIDNYDHYHMGNIQLTTFKQNQDNAFRDMRDGILKNITNPQKKVYQYTKTGVLMVTFVSTCEASRSTGVSQQNISSCCNGKRKSAGKFIWSYSPIHLH